MSAAPRLRVARPVTDLDRSVAMYCAGLGWSLLGRFEDHAGFDGAMVGVPGADHHLEFTRCRAHAVVPSPTAEDLIVFYVPDVSAWQERCAALRAAGFEDVPSFNPYWSVKGRTFADPDGYRLVLQNGAWPP